MLLGGAAVGLPLGWERQKLPVLPATLQLSTFYQDLISPPVLLRQSPDVLSQPHPSLGWGQDSGLVCVGEEGLGVGGMCIVPWE